MSIDAGSVLAAAIFLAVVILGCAAAYIAVDRNWGARAAKAAGLPRIERPWLRGMVATVAFTAVAFTVGSFFDGVIIAAAWAIPAGIVFGTGIALSDRLKQWRDR